MGGNIFFGLLSVSFRNGEMEGVNFYGPFWEDIGRVF
jgi:hypothetical protein